MTTGAIAVLTGLIATQAHAACAKPEAAPVPLTSHRLAAERAQQALKAKFGKAKARRFLPPKLQFDAKASAWLAYFSQRGPQFILDGDVNVWVKDRTGETCLAVGIDVGKCLIAMYPEIDPGPPDNSCRTEGPRP